MTPEIAQEFQTIEHKHRILKARLQARERDLHELQNEVGTIRCELQKVENDRFRVMAKV